MNERIKELLDKATYDVLGVKQVDQKQFAELIVKECAKVSATKAGVYDKDAFVAKRIKEHFGVEE